MNKDLIIDASSNEITIALLEDKKLVELNKEKSNIEFSVGDIYIGKVKKIMPGLNAAFVDIGYEKDAFLHYHDLGPNFRTLQKYLDIAIHTRGRPPAFQRFNLEPEIDKNGKIGDVLYTGMPVLVQIAKEPISTKGPRLTCEISIAGRNLVLLPFSNKVTVSQKIKSKEEKQRLKNIISSIKPNNYGVIVRTAAEGKKVKDFDIELRELVKNWESLFEKIKNIKIPSILMSEISRITAILRDMLNPSFTSIVVNNENLFHEIKEYIANIAPEKTNIVKFYNKEEPIFEHYEIDKQIKSSFGRIVSLKNGAYLVIEHTEALHVIDVNSGNRSKKIFDQETNALEVNLSAVDEIARQIRLRDLGGIIVIDFIDMNLPEHKQMINNKVKEAMSHDRAKHTILPLSKFCLMQITRQRVRPELNINTDEICPTCQGTGRISPSILLIDKIENDIFSILKEKKYKRLILKVHPFLSAYLKKGIISWKIKMFFKTNCCIKIKPIPSFDFLEYHILDKNNNELI